MQFGPTQHRGCQAGRPSFFLFGAVQRVLQWHRMIVLVKDVGVPFVVGRDGRRWGIIG